MLGLIGVMGALTGLQEATLNFTESGNEQFNASEELREQTRQNREEFERQEQEFAPFYAGLAMSFLFYIALIPIVFAIKNKPKIVGIILLALGVIAIPITNGYGIIPFALLLPAGILALRYKPKTTSLTTE